MTNEPVAAQCEDCNRYVITNRENLIHRTCEETEPTGCGRLEILADPDPADLGECMICHLLYPLAEMPGIYNYTPPDWSSPGGGDGPICDGCCERIDEADKARRDEYNEDDHPRRGWRPSLQGNSGAIDTDY